MKMKTKWKSKYCYVPLTLPRPEQPMNSREDMTDVTHWNPSLEPLTRAPHVPLPPPSFQNPDTNVQYDEASPTFTMGLSD